MLEKITKKIVSIIQKHFYYNVFQYDICKIV